MPRLAGPPAWPAPAASRAAAARAAAARAAAALARAAFRARSWAIARRWAACRAAAPLTLSWCTEAAITWSVAADAAMLRAPATLAASARRADAAGASPGQVAAVPAAIPARASAEPAAISVIFGVLGWSVLRCRLWREGVRLLRDNVNLWSGAGAPSVSTRAQAGHRGCGGGSAASGCGAGTGRPAAQKAAVITYAGCLWDPTMPETTIPVAEKYLLGVMRKVTQSHRSPTFTQVEPISGGQAQGPRAGTAGGHPRRAAAAQLSAGMISAP